MIKSATSTTAVILSGLTFELREVPTEWRQALVGENVQGTADQGLVARRWRSP
jgi:hypothetical protein